MRRARTTEAGPAPEELARQYQDLSRQLCGDEYADTLRTEVRGGWIYLWRPRRNYATGGWREALVFDRVNRRQLAEWNEDLKRRVAERVGTPEVAGEEGTVA